MRETTLEAPTVRLRVYALSLGAFRVCDSKLRVIGVTDSDTSTNGIVVTGPEEPRSSWRVSFDDGEWPSSMRADGHAWLAAEQGATPSVRVLDPRDESAQTEIIELDIRERAAEAGSRAPATSRTSAWGFDDVQVISESLQGGMLP